jgi:hypothetical protein
VCHNSGFLALQLFFRGKPASLKIMQVDHWMYSISWTMRYVACLRFLWMRISCLAVLSWLLDAECGMFALVAPKERVLLLNRKKYISVKWMFREALRFCRASGDFAWTCSLNMKIIIRNFCIIISWVHYSLASPNLLAFNYVFIEHCLVQKVGRILLNARLII